MEENKLGRFRNITYRNEGYMMTIPLSQFNNEQKYKNYEVSCRYQYNKEAEKYSLSMWLKRKDIDSLSRIEYEEVDTQLISGTRETIRPNICRIVEQAMKAHYFDSFIDRFDFEMKCMDRGIDMSDLESSEEVAV